MNNTNIFFALLFFAYVIEGSITWFKAIIVEHKLQWQMVVSLILGITVAVVFKIDLVSNLNIFESYTVFGAILTGIAMARGSNQVFDLIKYIQVNSGS